MTVYSDSKNPELSLVTNLNYDQSNFYIGFLPLFHTYFYRNQNNCELCLGKYIFTLHSSNVVPNYGPIIQYAKVTEFNGAKKDVGQTVHLYANTQLSLGGHARVPYLAPQYPSWHAQELITSEQLSDGTKIHKKQTEQGLNDPPFYTIEDRMNHSERDVKIVLVRNDGDCVHSALDLEVVLCLVQVKHGCLAVKILR